MLNAEPQWVSLASVSCKLALAEGVRHPPLWGLNSVLLRLLTLSTS